MVWLVRVSYEPVTCIGHGKGYFLGKDDRQLQLHFGHLHELFIYDGTPA